MATEAEFVERRKRFVEESEITKRLAESIIGMPAEQARAAVEAAGRQWAERCFTDDLGSNRVRVTVDNGVVTMASGG